jgi:hypothetical protein
MKIFSTAQIALFSLMINQLLKLIYILMFDLNELEIMFLDPTDLLINNINKYLNSNKTIKFIFS